MRTGIKWLIGGLLTLIVAFMLLPIMFGEADKIEADAYICGESPNQVTFYCDVGTGPPRDDCEGPSNGEFDIEGTTLC